MDQAIDAHLQLHKGAELRQVAHLPLLNGTYLILLLDLVPGIGLQLFDTQRDLPLCDVHVQDFGFDGLSQGEHLRGMADVPGPGHLADMHQPFHTFLQLHEGPIIGHAYNLARNHRVGGVFSLH